MGDTAAFAADACEGAIHGKLLTQFPSSTPLRGVALSVGVDANVKITPRGTTSARPPASTNRRTSASSAEVTTRRSDVIAPAFHGSAVIAPAGSCTTTLAGALVAGNAKTSWKFLASV